MDDTGSLIPETLEETSTGPAVYREPSTFDPTTIPLPTDLPAILGGTPAFSEPRLVGRPNMPDNDRFLDRIAEMLESGWLTNYGPKVREFEQQVAAITGAEHCIATCNGTVALELAISAAGITGGEVIVPSFTFVATAHSLMRQGITPVFCDVRPDTHCMDPASVEQLVTERTTGILAVTLWGNGCDEHALRDIADRHQIPLIADSAHSFGCDLGRSGTPSLFDAEILSFHATKCIHAIEGGAILTNDARLAERLRLMVNFGFETEDTVIYLGTNGKMTEASAAMGLTSLESRHDVFAHNQRMYERYRDGLAAVPGVSVMDRGLSPEERHNYQYVVVEIDQSDCGLTRDELVGALRLENVFARRYFYPGCHRMEPYKTKLSGNITHLPVTEAISARVMLLPNGLAMSGHDVDLATRRIASIVTRARHVRVALAASNDSRLPPKVPLHPRQ